MRTMLAAVATATAAAFVVFIPSAAMADDKSTEHAPAPDQAVMAAEMGDDHFVESAYAYGQSVATATVTCPDGYYASGGTASPYGGQVTNEWPTADGRGWTATATVDKNEPMVEGRRTVSLDVAAVCVHEDKTTK